MIGGKVINDVFYENVSFRNYGCLVGMAVVSLEWQCTVVVGWSYLFVKIIKVPKYCDFCRQSTPTPVGLTSIH